MGTERRGWRRQRFSGAEIDLQFFTACRERGTFKRLGLPQAYFQLLGRLLECNFVIMCEMAASG